MYIEHYKNAYLREIRAKLFLSLSVFFLLHVIKGANLDENCKQKRTSLLPGNRQNVNDSVNTLLKILIKLWENADKETAKRERLKFRL